MRILRVAAVLCVLSLFAFPARSQDNTPYNGNSGNYLIGACQLAVSVQNDPNLPQTGPDGFKVGYCFGISNGVAVSLTLNREACVPFSVTIGQEARVVEKFLQDHPAKLNQSGAGLAMQAIEEAFPCK